MTRPCLLERIDDVAVVQVCADGFTSLPLRDKLLVWHLYLAALAGRDIYDDQRYAHNLSMRRLLEEIADVEISCPCDLEAQMLEYSAFAQHDPQLTSSR